MTYLGGVEGREDKDEEDLIAKRGLGGRLKAAREKADLTQDGAAAKLGLKKQTISSWENGRNVPDAITLGKLAHIYETTADALLNDDSISMEAIHFAVQFDALSDTQQRMFRTMWTAYFTQAKTDAEVEDAFKRTRSASAPRREQYQNPDLPAHQEDEEDGR